MRFTRDERKNRRNRVKHGLSFETAGLVFDDPNALSIQDRTSNGEERWQTMGLIKGQIIVLVAHTFGEQNGEEIIRIISARKATPREREIYEKSRQ
jgi:uncharacterized DUF497 family protein